MTEETIHHHCLLCAGSELRKLSAFRRVQLVKCVGCGFVFCEKIPSEKELADYYSNYGLQQYLSPITVKRYHEWLDDFEQYRSTGNLLDIGCANGLFLVEAQKRGWKVFGTEYGSEQVINCRAKNITMNQGPLQMEMFPGIEFDVITSIEVIEHINNPVEELKIIHNKLRHGGFFYCTTPNFNALSRYILGDKYNIISYPEHLSYYTPSTLSKLMHSSGFKKIFSRTTGISVTRFNQSTGKRSQQVVSAKSDDELLRNKIETRWYLKMAKAILNFLFNLTGLGYSLKGGFEKSLSNLKLPGK